MTGTAGGGNELESKKKSDVPSFNNKKGSIWFKNEQLKDWKIPGTFYKGLDLKNDGLKG